MRSTFIVGRAMFTMLKLGGKEDDTMTTPTQGDPMVKGWKVTLRGQKGGWMTRDWNLVAEEMANVDDPDSDIVSVEEVEHPLSWWEDFEANAPEFGGW